MSDSVTQGTDQSQPARQVATQAAGEVASTAADQAGNVTQTAKEQTKAVVQTAQEQMRSVGTEVQHHARRVLRDTGGEVESQLDQRVQQLAEKGRSSGDELRALAEGRIEEAGRMGELASEAAQRLTSWSDRAQQLGPRGLADEAARMARRRPVAFLAGAATAGFLVGRVLRNANSGDELTSSLPVSTTYGVGSVYDDALAAPELAVYGAGAAAPPGYVPGAPAESFGGAPSPAADQSVYGSPTASPGGVG